MPLRLRSINANGALAPDKALLPPLNLARATRGPLRRPEPRCRKDRVRTICESSTRRPPAGSQPADIFGAPAYPSVTKTIDGASTRAKGGCTTAVVTFDNERAECATIISLSCLDYPGLLRTIAWVLRGLELRVEHCVLDTADGYAEDSFWITTRERNKLSDKEAQEVCDRLSDFVSQCFPAIESDFKGTLTHNNIVIDNKSDPNMSIMLVGVGPSELLDAFSTGYASEGPSLATLSIGELDPSHLRDSPDSGFTCPPPGAIEVGIDPAHFLLDVASAVSGAGLLVQKAIMKNWDSCDARTKKLMSKADGGKPRVFKLWVTDVKGNKLDYSMASGVLYTLDLVLKGGSMVSGAPTVAPGASLGVGIKR